MSEPSASAEPREMSREEVFSGLFAQLIIQQSNMALMLLGKVPHPESGNTVKDPEAAQLFIDQLEMIEAKTKGNLTRDETTLLKQTLMSLRLAFVDAVNSGDQARAPKPEDQPRPAEPAAQTNATAAPKPESSAAAEEEHRKKFSKKY